MGFVVDEIDSLLTETEKLAKKLISLGKYKK